MNRGPQGPARVILFTEKMCPSWKEKTFHQKRHKPKKRVSKAAVKSSMGWLCAQSLGMLSCFLQLFFTPAGTTLQTMTGVYSIATILLTPFCGRKGLTLLPVRGCWLTRAKEKERKAMISKKLELEREHLSGLLCLALLNERSFSSLNFYVYSEMLFFLSLIWFSMTKRDGGLKKTV